MSSVCLDACVMLMRSLHILVKLVYCCCWVYLNHIKMHYRIILFHLFLVVVVVLAVAIFNELLFVPVLPALVLPPVLQRHDGLRWRLTLPLLLAAGLAPQLGVADRAARAPLHTAVALGDGAGALVLPQPEQLHRVLGCQCHVHAWRAYVAYGQFRYIV